MCTTCSSVFNFTFFFNDTATTDIYTLSLHDALPISCANRKKLPTTSLPPLKECFHRLPPVRSASVWVFPNKALLQWRRSEEHTSELQSHSDLVCRLLLEKKKTTNIVYNKLIAKHNEQ